MKICIVAQNSNPHAGLGRVVHALANEFVSRSHAVGIIASGEDLAGCEVSNSDLNVSFRHPIILFKKIIAFRRFVRRYDVVVAFDPRPLGVLVYLFSLGLNKKLILQTLGTYALFVPKAPVKNFLMQLAYKKYHRVFVINEFVKRCIEQSRKGFVFGRNMVFVSVGVDTKYFSPIAQPSYKYAKRYILSVGAIKHRKGQLKSLSSFIKIAPLFPDVHYVIVGDTDENSQYVHQIRELVNKSGVAERIHFVEKITDVELLDLYSGALFFVLTPTTTTTQIEGLGMVYLEAGLCELPSLGTLGTGAECAIVDKQTGILVNDDEDSIANGMSSMLSDPVALREYGKNARMHALEYDWKFIVDKYEQEINSIGTP